MNRCGQLVVSVVLAIMSVGTAAAQHEAQLEVSPRAPEESAEAPATQSPAAQPERRNAPAKPAAADSPANVASSRVGFDRDGESGLRLRFVPVGDGISFYSMGLRHAPRRLCAQCELRVRRGYYQFGLSLGAREPIKVGSYTELTGDVTIEGVYTSAESDRAVGQILLATGIPSGLSAVVLGVALFIDGNEGAGAGSIAGGGLVTLVSLIVGTIMASADDEAEIFIRSE